MQERLKENVSKLKRLPPAVFCYRNISGTSNKTWNKMEELGIELLCKVFIKCSIFKTVVVEKFKVCGGLMVECS